jgi:hypothetical protein
LLKLWYSIGEAFNRESALGVNAFFDVGTELCPRAVDQASDGGVLVAEK